MQQHGIKARTKRKFAMATDSRNSLPVVPDLVQRRFRPEQLKQLWSGDITYIQTDQAAYVTGPPRPHAVRAALV